MSFRIEDLNYEKDSKERMPWEHYMELFQKADPAEIAERLKLEYDADSHVLTVCFLSVRYRISWPDFQVSHVDECIYYPLEEMIYAKILVMRYLLNAASVSGTGVFKTYREMPWGEVYLRQFNGRCILRLAYSYGNRQKVFANIMKEIGAAPLSSGDISYQIEMFPGYQLQLILWEGDEEFPPSAQILFSDNYPVSFQAEDMAVTGDVLIGSLKAIEKKV